MPGRTAAREVASLATRAVPAEQLLS